MGNQSEFQHKQREKERDIARVRIGKREEKHTQRERERERASIARFTLGSLSRSNCSQPLMPLATSKGVGGEEEEEGEVKE